MPLSAARTLLCGPRYALYFDGVGGYVVVPYSPSYKILGSGTWSCWAYIPSLKPSGGADIFTDGDYPYRRAQITLDYDARRFIWGFEGTRSYTPVNSLLHFVGRWLFLTYRRITEEGYHELRINLDEVIYSGTFTPGTLVPDSTTALTIAHLYPIMTCGIFYIHSRALSDKELAWNFNHRDNPVRNGLVLWLHWDSIDISAGKWYDKSAFGNHGTIYGATLIEPIRLKARTLSPVRTLGPAR